MAAAEENDHKQASKLLLDKISMVSSSQLAMTISAPVLVLRSARQFVLQALLGVSVSQPLTDRSLFNCKEILIAVFSLYSTQSVTISGTVPVPAS